MSEEKHVVTLVRQGGAQIVQWLLDRTINDDAKQLLGVFVEQLKTRLLEKYLDSDISFSVFLDEHCRLVEGGEVRAWLLHVRALPKGETDTSKTELVGEVALGLNENDFIVACYGGASPEDIASAQYQTDALIRKLTGQTPETPLGQDFEWVLLGQDAMDFLWQLNLPDEVGFKLGEFFENARPADYPEGVPVQVGVLKLKGQIITNTETGDQRREPMLEVNVHVGKCLEDMHPESKAELHHAQCFLVLDADGNVYRYMDATPLH